MRRSILVSLIILASFASAPALAGDTAPLFGGEGQPPFTPEIPPPLPIGR